MKKRGQGVILNNIGSAGENWDAAYVMSPLAGYISSTIITIDGGNASRRKSM